MPLSSVIGVDHVVVTVRDLDAAAAQWRALGFTLSPRGTHSAHLGTANYTIMFPDDYLELLGVITPTDQNAPTRGFLAEREGIERTAFTALDAEKGAEELRAAGLVPLGPVHFGRPVDLPDGSKGEARFSVFRWPLDQNPGGMRIFACQHHTRETVFIPAISSHANGTTRIISIEIVSEDPAASAAHMSRLIGQPVQSGRLGAYVPSGGKRAEFVFLNPESFSARYPQEARVGAASAGAVAMTLAVADLDATRKALGPAAVTTATGLAMPAASANGVIVHFVPA